MSIEERDCTDQLGAFLNSYVYEIRDTETRKTTKGLGRTLELAKKKAWDKHQKEKESF